MRILTASILAAALLGAFSFNVSAAGCKKGYTYDAEQGKCVKVPHGSHH